MLQEHRYVERPAPDVAPPAPDVERPARDVAQPAQFAELVMEAGIRKVGLPLIPVLALGMLAGVFVAFGGMMNTLALTGSELGLGPTRIIGGMVFSLGIILVVIGGAELFTGNNLILMAWADRRVRTTALLRNWGLVYLANLAGALVMVLLVYLSGILSLDGDALAQTARGIAEGKVALTSVEAFARGIFANALVCLAIMLSAAAPTFSGKVLAIAFPITAFVALGFEHSIANMYLIPIGALHADGTIGMMDIIANLIPVTLGNIVGGGVLIGLVYWLVYLRNPAPSA